MKVALLYPTVAALVEKMAALYPGLTVVGPPPDGMNSWDKRILPLAWAEGRLAEWREVGLDIRFDSRPYDEIDWSAFDVLLESVETFYYSADWRRAFRNVTCPVVVKVCWMNQLGDLPDDYVAARKDRPLLLEMPAHLPIWKASPFTDVTLAPEPVGDWWFERPWTGEREQALFVLAGTHLWRPADKSTVGYDLWQRIEAAFPGRTYHQDGAVAYRSTRQMMELFAESRVFVNLDRPFGGGERPLAASFTEAVAAGLPVVARDLPGLSYADFIHGNGVCSDDFEAICGFIEHCLTDIEFASKCSVRSREIGDMAFSVAAVKPTYDAAVARSIALKETTNAR